MLGLVETLVLSDSAESYPGLGPTAGPSASLSIDSSGISASASLGGKGRTLAFREHRGFTAGDDDDVHSFGLRSAVCYRPPRSVEIGDVARS
jgi:hypothetical protein